MSWVTRTAARRKDNMKDEEGNVKLGRDYKFCCHVNQTSSHTIFLENSPEGVLIRNRAVNIGFLYG